MSWVIDAHQHLAAEPYYDSVEAYEVDLVKAAERLEIDRFCVSAVGPIHHNRTNEEVEALMKRRPDLVIGMAHFRLGVDPLGRVREFVDRGFKGLKFICPAIPYDAEEALAVYESARDRGLVTYFHTGFLGLGSGPEKTHSDWMRPGRLDIAARWLPDLKIVIAHLGSPWFDEAAALIKYHANVWTDLTGDPCGRDASFFRERLYIQLDLDKLVYGTDSLPPDGHIPYDRQHRLVDELGLTDAQVRAFRGGAMARLLGL